MEQTVEDLERIALASKEIRESTKDLEHTDGLSTLESTCENCPNDIDCSDEGCCDKWG